MKYTSETDFSQQVELKSLADRLSQIEAQRKRRGRRYQLAVVLVLIVVAKLCGADTPVQIAQWVSERTEALKQALGLDWKRMPPHCTYRRILARMIKLTELEQRAREFLASLQAAAARSSAPCQPDGG